MYKGLRDTARLPRKQKPRELASVTSCHRLRGSRATGTGGLVTRPTGDHTRSCLELCCVQDLGEPELSAAKDKRTHRASAFCRRTRCLALLPSPVYSLLLFAFLPLPFFFNRERNSLEYSSWNTDTQAGLVLNMLLALEMTLILGFQIIISFTVINIIQSRYFRIMEKTLVSKEGRGPTRRLPL